MRRIWTPRWLLLHLAVVALVVAFLLLGWWQVGRAASGNLLSYGYSFQWPAFAAFVVYVWIKEVRRALAPPDDSAPGAASSGLSSACSPATGAEREGVALRAPGPAIAKARTRSSAYDDSDDAELAAYNHYLAWLNAHPHASPSEYPGR